MATIATLDVLLNLKDEFSKGLDKSSNSLDAWGKKLTKIGKTLTLGVTTPLVGAAGMAIKWASDLEETINKTNVLFDGASRSVIEWSEDSATAMGMSQQAALDFAGSFGGMLNTVAEGPTELANMSRTLTELTSDFASFHNLNPEDAFRVISSALAGEAEAIRRYGVDMSAANVEQVAMQMGLAATASELTAQDKALARYQILLNETTEEQGDFARTQDSVANRMKIARARVRDLGTSFGRLLLPYVQKALNYFAQLMDRFEGLSPRTQKIILLVGALLAVLGPVLIVIGMMLPALGALVTVFALLLSPIGLIVIAIAALIALGIYAWTQDLWGVRDAVASVMDALSIFKPVLDDLIDAFQALKEGDFAEVWDELKEAASTALAIMADLIRSVDWGNVLREAGRLLLAGLKWGAEAGWELLKAFIVALPGLIVDGAGILWNEVLKPAGKQIINGLREEISENWPYAQAVLIEGFKGIPGLIGDVTLLLASKGWDLMKGLKQGVTDWWDATVKPWFVSLPERVRVAISDVTEAILQKGKDLIAGLWDGITNRYASVKYWFQSLGGTIFGVIGSLLSTLYERGRELLSGFAKGISDRWSSIYEWLKGRGTAVASAVGSLASTLWSAGWNVINGFWNGAKSLWPSVVNWFKSLGPDIPSWKGPLEDDKRILIPAGKAVMSGFSKGLDMGWDGVTRQLSGYTSGLAAPMTANDVRPAGHTYVSISLKSEELIDLIRKAENGNAFASGFGSELGLRAGAF